MKRDDIDRAVRINRDLSDLESRLAHFQFVKKLNISSACCLEIQDYPEPSRIGRTFRAVRAAIVKQLEEEIAEAKHDLERIGVAA